MWNVPYRCDKHPRKWKSWVKLVLNCNGNDTPNLPKSVCIIIKDGTFKNLYKLAYKPRPNQWCGCAIWVFPLPAGVDEDSSVLHLTEKGFVTHALRVRSKGTWDDDEITLRHECVQRHWQRTREKQTVTTVCSHATHMCTYMQITASSSSDSIIILINLTWLPVSMNCFLSFVSSLYSPLISISWYPCLACSLIILDFPSWVICLTKFPLHLFRPWLGPSASVQQPLHPKGHQTSGNGQAYTTRHTAAVKLWDESAWHLLNISNRLLRDWHSEILLNEECVTNKMNYYYYSPK